MDVKIVVLGKYNDVNGKAKQYRENDTLTTRKWYADSLVESGLARNFIPRQRKLKEAAEEKPTKNKSKKKPKKQPEQKVKFVRSVTESSENPFAG